MDYRIAVDIGGTFTDCVVVDEHGARTVAKALTNPQALATGVIDALDAAGRQLERPRGQLLARCRRFVHGTTQATNAVVTRTGAPTGFITTKGHEDTLVIGRVYSKVAGLPERALVHASRLRKPEPIVPRALTRGITERIDREGEAVVALDEAEVLAAIGELVAAGVEAIGVSLLWSFLNSAHERRVGELIRSHAPAVFVSMSHETAPVLGEYERAVTAVVNAYVGPRVVGYLEDLEARLQADGLTAPLMVMQADGGLTSVAEAARTPIVTLDSGPAGGVLGCAHLGRLYDEANVICTDVGGTTFDVSVILRGEVPLTEEPVIGQYTLKLPKVDVEAVGAGGGSIAWIDEAGLLQVGPQSAASDPGPACYGRGGREATVTDADLVLGYLDPDAFLGGDMELDADAAREALARLGEPLGMSAVEVAAGIFRIINAQMADLISKSTIARGHDPRDCILVAYGGAGPTHAAFYGEDIAAQAIYVPAESTVFSAEGMLTCNVSHAARRSRTLVSPFADDELEQLSTDLQDLTDGVLTQFASEGTAAASVTVRRSVGMRFRNQVRSLDIETAADPFDAAAVALVVTDFARTYATVHGEGSMVRGGAIEIDQHRVRATLAVDPIPFAERPLSGHDPAAALTGRRPVHFQGQGFVDTEIYDGGRLAPGNRVYGPAIIQRMGDSIVAPPGYEADVDARGTIVLRRAEEKS